MLHILQLEEIESKLLEVSELVNKYEKNDPVFVNCAEHWLKEIDLILQRNRMGEAGKIAVLRGGLFSVRNGTLPQGLEFTGRTSKRKRLTATAHDALKHAVDVITLSIQGDRARFDEANRIAVQLISISKICGLIRLGGSNQSGPEFSRSLISSMKSTEATVQGIVQLEGLTGISDAIIIIDRSLNYGLESG